MKVYSRPINAGETFCTSIKTAKSIYENTEIHLCFGEFGRQYNPHKNEIGFGYYSKNIRGKVVANMILHPGVDCPLLSFYVIKSNDISTELKNHFQHDILYQLLEIYNQFLMGNPFLQKSMVVWVELINENFYIHKFVLK